jgi:hypothetical protein
MKILITEIDCKKLDEKHPKYRREVARTDCPRTAALCAFALVREAKAQKKDLWYSLAVQRRRGSDDLGAVFLADLGSEIEVIDRIEAAWKNLQAENAKWKRIWKFVDLYRGDRRQVTWEQYNRVWDLVRADAPAWSAITAERYEEAAARLETMGIARLEAPAHDFLTGDPEGEEVENSAEGATV